MKEHHSRFSTRMIFPKFTAELSIVSTDLKPRMGGDVVETVLYSMFISGSVLKSAGHLHYACERVWAKERHGACERSRAVCT